MVQLQDKAAVLVFTFGGIFLLWYQACHVLPFYYHDNVPFIVYIHHVAAAWLAFNIYFNMYKVFTTETSCQVSSVNKEHSLEPWGRCEICLIDTPPRSHHCKVCNVCILKRDHHCWFAGSCIGYHNHRYYVVMVIYMVVTGIYCNVFNFDFVWTVKGGFGFLDIFWFFAPHAGWVFGFLDNYVFCITLLHSVGCLITFLFLWLLCIQTAQIVHGQTKYERKKEINKYNRGLKHTIREVFGSNWYIVGLSPFFPSTLPGNGYAYELTEQKME